MDKKTETGELDLSISKLMSGCGTARAKNRFKNNEPNQSDASFSSGLGSLLNSSVSLDPTPTLMPTRSSISSLLSLSRLFENPITASAAAAMAHFMDINNSAFSSAFGYVEQCCTYSDGHSIGIERSLYFGLIKLNL
jgi:hypothetical protein